MTTRLTETGWENVETVELLGTWTNQVDLVDEGDEIIVDSDVTANTLAGADTIFGLNSINNQGTIDTGDGNDTISSGGIGGSLINEGTIDTGDGNDIISAGGRDESLVNEGTIETGFGNDAISGSTGGVGITNSGLIDTGDGHDTITGSGLNPQTISIGIDNDGTIKTGNGRDTVDALTGGFSGDGTINLGDGDDLIRGFGNQIVDGGRGFDTAQFDFISDEVDISIISDNSLVLAKSSEEMTFTNVELFEFSDVSFSFSKIDFAY